MESSLRSFTQIVGRHLNHKTDSRVRAIILVITTTNMTVSLHIYYTVYRKLENVAINNTLPPKATRVATYF